MKTPYARALSSEALGTAFLLMAVLGSGIMAERLSGGNAAIALLANTLTVGAVLAALILTFGPLSGAHFNPVVTLSDACSGGLKWRKVPGYLIAQVLGAFIGTALAHRMFELPYFFASTHSRRSPGELLGEFIATFGLLAVIRGSSRRRAAHVPLAVAAYIMAAYWFTASTAFANPAATLARAASDTFAGIQPSDVSNFVLAQLAGAAAATFLFNWLVPAPPRIAHDVPVPQDSPETPNP